MIRNNMPPPGRPGLLAEEGGESSKSKTAVNKGSVGPEGEQPSKKVSWEAEDAIQSATAHLDTSRAVSPRADTTSRVTLSPLPPDLQRRSIDPAQKGTRPSGLTYQKMFANRAQGLNNQSGSASDRVRNITSLRSQSLKDSGLEGHTRVPGSEKVNQLHHRRSMDGSLEKLKNDPSLTLPPRLFPRGINSTDQSQLPYSQRPGPETRLNDINISELARAQDKHGNKRLPRLTGADEKAAIQRLTSLKLNGQPISNPKAKEILTTEPLSGGYPKPRSSRPVEVSTKGDEKTIVKPNEVQVVNATRRGLWDPKTREATEARGVSRGDNGYGDPVYNPEGKMVTYVTPSGRGTRFDQLNIEHVANTVEHNGALVTNPSGQDFRTVRGFTNPVPYSAQSIDAESQRNAQDRARTNGALIKRRAQEFAASRKEKAQKGATSDVLDKPADIAQKDKEDAQDSYKIQKKENM